LSEIGVKIDESTVVAKIVSALPDEDYSSFKSAWDSVADKEQTMNRLLARLKKEELVLKQKQENDQATGASGSGDKEEPTIAFKSRMQNKHVKKKNGNNGSHQDKKPKGKCYHCGKPGHFKKDCRSLANEEQDGSSSQRKATYSNNNKGSNKDDPCTAFMTLEKHSFISQELIWWSDSGANRHYTGYSHWYVDYKKYIQPRAVTLSDNNSIWAEGEGTVVLEAYMNNSWKKVRLTEVAYIPGGVSLFSECVMAQKGYRIIRDKEKTDFELNGKKGPQARYYKSGYAMVFRPISINERAFMAKTPINTAKLWHERIGHINMQYLRESVKQDAVRGISEDQLKDDIKCDNCQFGKATKGPFKESSGQSYSVGEFIHACSENTILGFKHFPEAHTCVNVKDMLEKFLDTTLGLQTFKVSQYGYNIRVC